MRLVLKNGEKVKKCIFEEHVGLTSVEPELEGTKTVVVRKALSQEFVLPINSSREEREEAVWVVAHSEYRWFATMIGPSSEDLSQCSKCSTIILKVSTNRKSQLF